jgi:hypothetical protein
MTRRRKTTIAAALATALLLATATAYAFEIRAGNIVIHAEGGFSPKALPRTHNAPITLHGGGRLSTVSGELPPVLKTLTIEYDRHGSVETTGLPVCAPGRLQATTVPEARRACPGAIVGEGAGRAIVKFPEERPIPISSPITIFNGPRFHGDPTVLAHAFTTVPIRTTFIVPIVIERIHDGVYGYRTKATIPPIAGGYGIPIAGHLKIGRKWAYKGRRYSYVNARCENGRLQAKGEFTFSDGTFLSGSIFKPCEVRSP